MDAKIIRLSDGATVKDPATDTDTVSTGCVLVDPVKQDYDPSTKRLRPLSTGEQIDRLINIVTVQEARIAALEQQMAALSRK